jgi:GrpB-like predicted nucleotidyltransferase (UPF0157 family)
MRKVEVVAYDRAWPRRAEAEIRRILKATGGKFVAVEHIGSTSVPGLAAKPVIDLLGEVADIAQADACNSALKALGYQARGEYGIPGRRYFCREEGARHTHHLHVFATGDPGLERHRALRDYLRAHNGEADVYGALKVELAWRFPADFEAYMDGKDAFVKELERKALAWRAGISKRTEPGVRKYIRGQG